jgi:catecholate siderophore receptor
MKKNPKPPAWDRARKTKKALLAVITAQGVCAGASGQVDDRLVASLEEKPVQLPGVVVSGATPAESPSSPKLPQPVLDAPQTISVIPPEVYEAQGAASLSDVLRNTPGITFFAGEGGSANRTGGDSFYLRGFDTSNSIFIDGVRDEGAAVHDVFNIEQVEVFKGPSAENGRGGTAGYINLETKMPGVAAFQNLELSHGFGAGGSQASDRVTLDVDQPLGALPVEGAALRVNLMDQQGGVPGRDYAENNRWGVAPSLALGLGTPTRAFVSYQHQYEHNIPDYGLPSTVLDGYAPDAAGRDAYFSPGVDTANYYGFVAYDYEHVTSDAATLRLEHDFSSGATLSNQTRYDVTSRQVEATSPTASVTVAPPGEAGLSQGIYQTRNEIVSNQTNLRADFTTGPLAHVLTSGVELSRETSDNPIWAVVPPGAANPSYLVSIYDPEDFPGALLNYAPHPTGSGTDTRIDTAALYAFDAIKLSRLLDFLGGVRLERYGINELSTTVASPAVAAAPAAAGVGGAPPTAPTALVAAVPASITALSAARTTASWKTGFVFKPAPDGSLYVSYDTSVRPPGTSGSTNTLSTTSTSADNPLLEPEKAVNYEAGAKWAFFHERLLADIAIFRSVNTNVPAADPVSGLVDQASDQTVQGAELGVSGKITGSWLLFAGFSQMEAKVSNEISANAQGLTLPLLPKESGNLWTTYRIAKGLTLGGGAQYMGETERLQATNAPTATTFTNQVPAYWVFNGMVSFEVNRHVTIRVNLNNLSNREYVASLNNNGYRLNLGAPRNFLLTLDLRF